MSRVKLAGNLKKWTESTAESLRILRILLYKNLLIRQRQWKISLFGEFLLTNGIVILIWAAQNALSLPPVTVTHDSYFPRVSQKALVDAATANGDILVLLYAPNPPAVVDLMKELKENCLTSENKSSRTSFNRSQSKVATSQSSNLAAVMQDIVQNDFYKLCPTVAFGFDSEALMVASAQRYAKGPGTVGIVFDQFNETTPKLKYKLMSYSLFQTQLYNILEMNMTQYYTEQNRVALVQLCLDEAFTSSKSSLAKSFLDIRQIYIQRLPLPPYSKISVTEMLFRLMFAVILILVFMIPLFIETLMASNERFVGVNVLMSMNGVSNKLNIFSWLISSWIFLSVSIILPTIVLYSACGETPFFNHGNPLIIWIVFNIYVVQLLAYGLHVSAYFSKSWLIVIALLILNVAATSLQNYAFKDDFPYLEPYFGVFFPNFLFIRAVDEINYYETIGLGVQWNNLFYVGKREYTSAGSMGVVLILSIIGIIFHFTMAVYLYAIKPGKYGIKKHPLYFLQRRSHKTDDYYVETVQENGVGGAPFETIADGVYKPGITIRNLKKDYNISLFSDMKIHALQGVSIDFYEGQITSLLGHNGAGKTTMMSILSGMMSPSEGVILVNSKNIKNNLSEILNDMGLCTQENMLFPNLSVVQQLTFFAMLKGKDKSKAEIRTNVKTYLEKMKLFGKRNALPKELSGGQKRKVCLGMALVGNPSTLILDEPTSGLDPESRRLIWNLLLKMRGQKTILISTHDMEEANILGDRIAILHGGKLRSYGTSMFLKKLIGEGNVEVTLSVEPSCYPEKILQELGSHGKIVSQDGSKIVVSVSNSPDLPNSLDRIESQKKQLGVSGLSVSLISLEQVFLKVTQDDDGTKKIEQPYRTADHWVANTDLFWQSFAALVKKKMMYTLKNVSTIIIMLCLVAASLLFISLILKKVNVQATRYKETKIELSMYNRPEVFYKINHNDGSKMYKKVVEDAGGKVTDANKSSLNSVLLNYSKKSFAVYENNVIAAAELNTSFFGYSASIFYSNKAVFSLPISINLLTNTMIKSAKDGNYSIDTSYQMMPAEFNKSYPDNTMINAYFTTIIFCFLFYPSIAFFGFHPLRETSTGIKHLQQMTGISDFTYWGSMFLFDFVVLLALIVLTIGGFAVMDKTLDFRIYSWESISISLLCYVLFAINALPLVYCFSFTKAKTNSFIKLLTYIPIGFVVVEIIMATIDLDFVTAVRPYQKQIFLLMPYVSFFNSQLVFYTTAQTNARCELMPNEFYDINCNMSFDVCCTLGCYDHKCANSVKYFTNFEKDVTLEESLIYLGLTPILYFGILLILEHQLIQKLMMRVKSKETPAYQNDDQVEQEKSRVAQKISTMNGYNITASKNNIAKVESDDYSNTPGPSNNQVFLVYELRKWYGNLMAVKDVSFGVNQRECFGLLGVNGAGKSTTFRMMTGVEVPHSGIMYIGDKNIQNNRKHYLSQMGYCPQNDAIIRSLNAYDHLRLFARLRGIPEDRVETEVNIWINKLNLNACASQPSGTFSGGNKRRLNIAIALIGVPNLVLLDEPTTGVDPGARRSLWNVIQSCQTMGQAVILTTHSMEEGEALCSRLAIMVGGKLVCIGPCQELKQRFGAGYDIHVKMNPEKARDQVNAIKEGMSQALTCELIDEHLGYLMYHVTPSNTTWKRMYDVMNRMKSKHDCIDDFSVLSSTLEQLFLMFARSANDVDR